MPDVKSVLENIGLTSNEIEVYMALLDLGPSMAGKLSKQIQLNRSSTYNALRGLLKRGFVHYVVEANRKVYGAADPKRLFSFLKENEEDIKQVMPKLEEMFKQQKVEENVTLYKGLKGIKTVFEDIINEGKPNLVFGSEGQFVERMPWYVPHFVRKIQEKGIKIRHIARQGRDVSNKTKTTDVRWLPFKVESPVATNIYSDKIAIVIWSKVPEAVIIKNKTAADAYRELFDVVWNMAKRR